MADNPYVRVYHSIVDDPKFATVYDDDRRLATWLRLLIVAEQAYPNSATIPQGTHRPSVKALVEAGLIDLGTGSRFRLHGLASEREMRSQSARIAAAVRWQSDRNASTSTRRVLDENENKEDARKRANGKTPKLRPMKSSPAAREFRDVLAEEKA